MLKKLSIIVPIYFCLTINLFAQKFDRTKIAYSLQASFNLSWFNNDIGGFDPRSPGYAGSFYSNFDKYYRVSPSVIITADYPISPRFWIAAGLAYNGRGGGYEQPNTGVTIKDNNGDDSKDENYYNFKIDYIEVPLLAQYSLLKPIESPHGGFTRNLLLYGGFAPGVKLFSAARYLYYDPNVPTTSIFEKKARQFSLNNVNTFNLSPVAGLQWGDDRSSNSFYMDLRFEYAAFPVFNNSANDGYNYNTRMWSGSLGFGLRIL